jgi:hypothetical protein
MPQSALEKFISQLPNVQRSESWGYIFFFVGDDQRIPFVSIADSDNEHDNDSDLDREGVFRVNIGVKKETFVKLVGELDQEHVDYTALNTFMPHPHYAKQFYVCILNPQGDNMQRTKDLIEEAHGIAEYRTKLNILPR